MLMKKTYCELSKSEERSVNNAVVWRWVKSMIEYITKNKESSNLREAEAFVKKLISKYNCKDLKELEMLFDS